MAASGITDSVKPPGAATPTRVASEKGRGSPGLHTSGDAGGTSIIIIDSDNVSDASAIASASASASGSGSGGLPLPTRDRNVGEPSDADSSRGEWSGWAVLNEAVHQGHEGVCKALLAASVSVAVGEDRSDCFSALEEAVRVGNARMCEMMLENGADVNAVNEHRELLVMHALRANRPAVLAVLIRHGANLNVPGCYGRTALIEAAHRGNAEMCRMLIDAGAGTNSADVHQDTPLHHAVFSRNIACVRCLLGAGADTEAKNENGETPLALGVFERVSAEMCDALIDAGASLQSCLSCSRGTLQFMERLAEHEDYVGIMRRALEAGVNPNSAYGPYGTTALVAAAEAGLADMCTLLLDYGAVPSAADTSLIGVARLGLVSLCKRLLDLGADPNCTSTLSPDVTPLLAAAQSNRVDVAALLLRYGAHADGGCLEAFPPLLIAAERHCAELCDLLLAHGADVNRFDPQNRDRTPLSACAEMWIQFRWHAHKYDTTSVPLLRRGPATAAALLASRHVDFSIQRNAKALLVFNPASLRSGVATVAWYRRAIALRARHARNSSG